MHPCSIATLILGVVAALMCNSSSASVISCPPSNLPESSAYIRQLCFAIEQAINDNTPVQDQLLGGNSKRQDVDHVFLRFGRRLGF